MSEPISIEDIFEEQASDKVVDFLRKGDDCISVDYFVTAHLSQSKQQVAEHHIKHFRNKLDREMCGRGRRLYKLVFVEEGLNALSRSYNERHCHLLIQKPKHLTKAQFASRFDSLWEEICGSSNIHWKRITIAQGGVGGLISYCNKESRFGNKPFRAELSDNSYQQKHRQI